MAKIEINREKCKGCGLCIIYCPNGAIKKDSTLNIKGVYPAIFDQKDKKCTGCTFCAIICPECCIKIYK